MRGASSVEAILFAKPQRSRSGGLKLFVATPFEFLCSALNPAESRTVGCAPGSVAGGADQIR